MGEAFWQRINLEFPDWPYSINRYCYQQFYIQRLGRVDKLPDIGAVKRISGETLAGYDHDVTVARSSMFQGAGTGDILVIIRGKGDVRLDHCIGLNKDVPKVTISTTWRGAVETEAEIEAYTEFAKRYFASVEGPVQERPADYLGSNSFDL